MSKKNRHSSERSFIQRIRFKYRVSILNENTLEETFHAHLSPLAVTVMVCIFALFSFAIISLITFYTPIKHFLPGYADAAIRADLVQKSMEVDSLQTRMHFQDKQMAILKMVLTGTIPIDSVAEIDSIKLENLVKVLDTKSERETQFCNTFEEEEKFSTLNIQPTITAQTMVFMKPTSGVVAREYNPQEQYGIDIAVAENSAVSSVQSGTIVSTDYTFDRGFSVVVQHADNYISVYKNLSQLFKQSGNEVKSGEVLGIVGSNSETQLYFELWQNGKNLNPTEYIIF